MKRYHGWLLRVFLVAAMAVLADWLFMGRISGVITVKAEGDDCGWVVDWNHPDGGYCSYYVTGSPADTYPSAEDSYSYVTEPRSMTWYGQYSNPDVQIGVGTMKGNGCVPTAGSILLSGYGIYISPTDLGWYLYGTGNFNNYYGHGGTDLCWYDIAAYAGLGAWGIYDYDSFVSALQGGASVACHIYYGGSTHAVVATGYNNGKTTVYDPISGSYTKDISSLWNGRSFEWVDCLSGTSVTAIQ